MPNDPRPPDLKLGPWDIWTSGERPPDQPQGGQLTGSTYRWVRWEDGPWMQCELPLHRLLRVLSYLRPWDYNPPERRDCPDCGGDWYRMEHAEDCPRGKALRLMDNSEPEIRKRAAELLDLPEGWDSYGAKRINPESAQLAVRVAQALATVADFRMVPMSSGGVALEAHDSGQDVEITIEPADAEPGMPWWEPRPWGDDGPPRCANEDHEAFAFVPGWGWLPIKSVDGKEWWFDDGDFSGSVRDATHWMDCPPDPRKD